MKKIIIALCGVLLPLLVMASESADQPAVKPGDKWIYRETLEKHPNTWSQKQHEMTVVRANEMGVLLATKESGSTLAPREKLVPVDWSYVRNVNGEDKIVKKPLKFPLSPGKSWKLEYVNDLPGKLHKNIQHTISYKASGWEEVEIPAGRFKAIRIEAQGTWKGEVASGIKTSSTRRVSTQSGSATLTQNENVTPQTLAGKLFNTYWYAPSVKRVIKSIEESYTPDGTRFSRLTSELVTYAVAP